MVFSLSWCYIYSDYQVSADLKFHPKKFQALHVISQNAHRPMAAQQKT